jgi:Protein of unknown function (DUF3303)
MKFIVEFKLQPGTKNHAVETFESRGPNRIPGVNFVGAWVATHADLIYAMGESSDATLAANACRTWDPEENFTITPVIDIEQF